MKNYISVQNLSIFAVGCLFIAMSIFGLGHINMMVGGFGVFLLKAIINKDFSSKPLTSILYITFYTLTIGFLPSLVNLNPFTGIIINFISIFIILYLLVYSLKETIYVPFLLGYAFFLCAPATGNDLKLRLIGLLIVAVVSVIFQIIYFKFQGVHYAFNNLNKSLTLLHKLIDTRNDDTAFNEVLTKLEKHNSSWNKDILNNKKNAFYLTKEENILLNLVSSLASFRRTFIKIRNDENLDLNEVDVLFSHLKLFIKDNYKRYEIVEEFSEFNTKINSKKQLTDDEYELIELINIIFSLTFNLYDIKKGTIKISRRSKIRDYIILEKNLFKDFRRGSSRFTFSFRTALLISITYFFVDYFHLRHGSWAIYTIVSISQPYYDITKQRAFERIRGTIIGGLIFVILDFIFRGFNAQLVLIFIAIYFVICLKDYVKRITAATVMSLMIVSISSGGHAFFATWDRLFYVIVGGIIVIIGSFIILPYKVETEIKDLSNIYYSICNNVIENLLHLYDKKDKIQIIDNLILEGHNIETKIKVNNSAYDIKILSEYIATGDIVLETSHRIINRTLHYDYALLTNKYERMEKLREMKKDIDAISDLTNIEANKFLSKYFKNLTDKGEILVYKEMLDMLLASRRLTYLKEKMDISTRKKEI
ncbi:MAG: FUSC family protein [Sarcina sp.]